MTVFSGVERWGVGAWTERVFRNRSVRTLEDGALLKQAGSGDEAACRELLERYGARLFAVVQTAHGDLGLSEDVVQEAFLRAIRKHDQLQTQQSFFPWLVKIALRVAIDFRRRTKEALMETCPEGATLEEAQPDHQCMASEDAALVRRSLAQLRPYPRELLTLRYFTQMSVAELAEVFGKSEVAIRKDLQRARVEMKQHLAPWFDGGAS